MSLKYHYVGLCRRLCVHADISLTVGLDTLLFESLATITSRTDLSVAKQRQRHLVSKYIYSHKSSEIVQSFIIIHWAHYIQQLVTISKEQRHSWERAVAHLAKKLPALHGPPANSRYHSTPWTSILVVTFRLQDPLCM